MAIAVALATVVLRFRVVPDARPDVHIAPSDVRIERGNAPGGTSASGSYPTGVRAKIEQAYAALRASGPGPGENALHEYLAQRITCEADPRAGERVVVLAEILVRQEAATRSPPGTGPGTLAGALQAARTFDLARLPAHVREPIQRNFFGQCGLRLSGSPIEISRGARAIFDASGRFGGTAEPPLREAAALLRESDSRLTRYESERQALSILRSEHPDVDARFGLSPEAGLDVPPNPHACPPSDARFAVARGAIYQVDAKYVALAGRADAELPDGAIRLLVGLLSVYVPDARALDGMNAADDAAIVLGRYGARALPCLLEALRDPAATASNAGGTVSLLQCGWRRAAGNLPTDAAMRLYTAAFEAGWDRLPEARCGSYRHELGALEHRYRDSPFRRH